jgi:hypothetical protein
VDDIVLTASSAGLLRRTIDTLQREFSMKDLGELHHFLGMHVQRSGGDFKKKYMLEILDRAGMSDCKTCSTLVDTHPKLSAVEGAPVADLTDFRSLAGALQHLTFTRPDIAYAVQQVCLHMHDPREPHLAALKRILRYIRGTLHIWVSFYGHLLSPISWFIHMLIGLVVQTLASPPLATQYFWVTISSLGPPSISTLFLARAPRLSIELWPMPSQRLPGCANFLLS